MPTTSIDSFLNTLSFDLDDFQMDAIRIIDSGKSCITCAPTGAGKTIIAEFAALKAIEEGKKLFYTTPLKALSNQKYFDLKQRYGEDFVGILTGDTSINRDARLVVMTTEVFRNMLYGLSEDSTLLDKVGYVVLDECHFMNDAQRGTVWEESIIYCPHHIQLIGLSATVANAQELTDWIQHIHHDTVLVESDFRPVPLRFYYFSHRRLVPLFEQNSHGLNHKIKFDNAGGKKPFPPKKNDFQPNQLILEMHDRNMLPAIFFTFSRKGCDNGMRGTMPLDILTLEERHKLGDEISAFINANPYIAESAILPYLSNGFAAHHAGLLPAEKHLVETLFQKGLIKAVFATETLAAGINMPARSTVITAISKRGDEGHRLLTASEFLQMSGRAGRRGLDDQGHVVVVSTPFNTAQEAARLASSPPDPLNSQFTPTYGMVLNLLERHSLEEARHLIQQSFGQYTVERRLSPLTNDLAEKQEQLNQAHHFPCPANLTLLDFEGVLKQREHISVLNKQMGTLKKQQKKYGPQAELDSALRDVQTNRRDIIQKLEAGACHDCPEFKNHRKVVEKRERLEKQVHHLEIQLGYEREVYWQSFLNIYSLLQEAGYINVDDKPTPIVGSLAAQIRTENEFFFTEVINLGLLNDLDPSSLAGVICSLIYDSTRTDNVWSEFSPSPKTRNRLSQILNELRRVKKLQDKYEVDVPLLLNPVAAGVVEAWVKGLAWDDLTQGTSIDPGNLVRLLRRTADILRQLSRIPDVSSELAQVAIKALRAAYRDPIKEVEIVEIAEVLEEAGGVAVPEEEGDPSVEPVV